VPEINKPSKSRGLLVIELDFIKEVDVLIRFK
jgi:hypothetical protein